MNEKVIETLEPLGIPVVTMKYTGDTEPYIEFSTYLEQGENFADDKEIVTGHYIQLHLFGKENLELLAKEVKSLMLENGFIRKMSYDAGFENRTELFHKVFRFYITEEE